MKAIFLLALVGGAAAATAGYGAFNPIYVKSVAGNCIVQPGYALYCMSAKPTGTVTTATANVIPCLSNTVDVGIYAPDATGTLPCLGASADNAGAATQYVIGCAANYTPSGLTSPNTQIFSAPSGTTGTPSWLTTSQAVTNVQGWSDISAAGTAVLACLPAVPAACNYTCTTVGTGSGCKAAAGTAAVGATPQSLCNSGYFSAVTSPSTATASCPAGGLNQTTWIVTCSNDATAYTTTAQWFLIASGQSGWSEPKSCNCAKAPTCAKKNVNSPTCSRCDLTPCVQTNAGLGTLGAVRANTFAAAAFCPAGTNTIAAMWDCFEQAACGGAIAKGDLCIFGVANQAGTAPCPTCPGGSKKGLLGLLGLLGLIPLLLCSSLLCLLLFCIRRNKKERDVHFATFDAGAPQVVAPVCHDFPVAHQTQTVHHATYVGPQHCAVPSGFGY